MFIVNLNGSVILVSSYYGVLSMEIEYNWVSSFNIYMICLPAACCHITSSLNNSINLDQSVHGRRGCRSNQSFQFGSREVLGVGGEFFNFHVASHFLVLPDSQGVDVQDLPASVLVRQSCEGVEVRICMRWIKDSNRVELMYCLMYDVLSMECNV